MHAGRDDAWMQAIHGVGAGEGRPENMRYRCHDRLHDRHAFRGEWTFTSVCYYFIFVIMKGAVGSPQR